MGQNVIIDYKSPPAIPGNIVLAPIGVGLSPLGAGVPAITGIDSGPFAAPDLADVNFGDTVFDPTGWTNGGGAWPGPGHSGLNTGGLFSGPIMRRSFAPPDGPFSPSWYNFGAQTHVYAYIVFRFNDPMKGSSSGRKLFRWKGGSGGGQNQGRLGQNGGGALGPLAFSFDTEALALDWQFGLFLDSDVTWFTANVGAQFIHGINLQDGNFHAIEMEYDRSGSVVSVPRIRFWFIPDPLGNPNNHIPCKMPFTGTAPAWYDILEPQAEFVSGGGGADDPDWLQPTGGGINQNNLNQMAFFPAASAITDTGTVDWDLMRISTQRIGLPTGGS